MCTGSVNTAPRGRPIADFFFAGFRFMLQIYPTKHFAPTATDCVYLRGVFGLTKTTQDVTLFNMWTLIDQDGVSEINSGSPVYCPRTSLVACTGAFRFNWIHQTKKGFETWQSRNLVIRGA